VPNKPNKGATAAKSFISDKPFSSAGTSRVIASSSTSSRVSISCVELCSVALKMRPSGLSLLAVGLLICFCILLSVSIKIIKRINA
jgi:hypothetical protein